MGSPESGVSPSYFSIRVPRRSNRSLQVRDTDCATEVIQSTLVSGLDVKDYIPVAGLVNFTVSFQNNYAAGSANL